MWISLVFMIVLNFFIIFGALFYLLDIKYTFGRLFSCFLVNSFIAILSIIYQNNFWLPLILSIIISSGIFYIISKNKIVFFHVVVINLLAILVEYLSLIVVQELQLSILVHGLLIIITYFIFLYFYKRFVYSYLHRSELSNKSYLILLLIVIITFIVFYMNVFVPSNKGELVLSTFNLFVLSIYLIIMFILSLLLLQTIQKQTILENREATQHYFHEYMQGLEEVNRKMYAFQHDYSNILLSMRGYLENEDIEGLKKYFHSTIVKTEELTMQKNHNFKELEKMKIVELKGLLGAKLLRAHSLNIITSIEVPETIADIQIDLMDLTRVLGVFLDNAIEASQSHLHPHIKLAIIQMGQDEIVIVIQNVTQQQFPNIKQLFEENYSTKGISRGHGLFNVKQILSQYPTIDLNTYLENGWFIQEMVIKRERD